MEDEVAKVDINQIDVKQLLDNEEFVKALQEKVVDKKRIKETIDKAYSERDEAKKEAELLEAKLAEAEKAEKDKAEKLKSLEAEGKTDDVNSIKIQKLTEQLETYKQDSQKKDLMFQTLQKDNVISSALSDKEFANEKAKKTAINEIAESLQQNDLGYWVNKDGLQAAEAIEAYVSNEDNVYLFKPKMSKGVNYNSLKGATGNTATSQGKKFTELSHEAQVEYVRNNKILDGDSNLPF